MGLRDFFKKSPPAAAPPPPPPPPPPIDAPPPPTGVAPPPGNPGVTKIEREHFLLHAPFQWVAVPGDNPMEFEFRNQTLREQLIVTVLLAREPFSGPKLREVAEQLAQSRLKAIARLSEGRAVASAVNYRSGSGQVEARCLARDDANKVRLAWVIRVAPTKVVTVALSRYFLEEVGSPFEAYAGSIFDFLQVKNSGGTGDT